MLTKKTGKDTNTKYNMLMMTLDKMTLSCLSNPEFDPSLWMQNDEKFKIHWTALVSKLLFLINDCIIQ